MSRSRRAPWKLVWIVASLSAALMAADWSASLGQQSGRPRRPRRPRDPAVEAAPQQPQVDVDPLDWPNWRGPEQNGVSRETGLIESWDPDSGENLLWRRPELGTRSTPIILRGKLYTLARSEPMTPREGERVVCADAATGEIKWEHKFNVYLSDVPDTRVAWGCCVGDPVTGNIYAMGVCGYFVCLDGETGEVLWRRSLSEEFGLLSTYGGRTNVPVIYEDLVIINAVVIGWGEMARPTHRFMAFNKLTGEMFWFSGTTPLPDDTTYSTPTLAVIGGQPELLFGSGDGRVWSFQPRTGAPIWNYRLSLRGLNLSPLVDGDVVYMGQSEENPDDNTMGAFAALDGLRSGEVPTDEAVWRRKEFMVGKSSPVLVDGRLYGADDSGFLYIVDAKTGEQIGEQKLTGTIMRASLLYADGKIYACTVNAWHVLAPTVDGVEILHRLRFPEGEEVHGSPIVSHGRVYLPTTEAMYCLALPDSKPTATERPAAPVEEPMGENTEPAHVQVVPVESLIRPGETVKFRARLFNNRGQFLKETEAEYSLSSESGEVGGTIDSQGVFMADASAAHVGTVVTAQIGELKGTARIRIVPPLPWHFDFANQQIPITWVGARYRHQPREVDGDWMMVKITTIPKGTRSQCWMGPNDLHDYTIQADVRGSIKNDKLPDMGVIAQRYTLDLMGQSQQLQIRSWTSQLERFSVTVPFAWQPDVWYTIKLQASTDGEHAVLRGKVWPRGEPEPETWTVEGVDEAGNLQGSPGLFGNASNAEIFIDNISVVPNE